jgi:hypothetical protein
MKVYAAPEGIECNTDYKNYNFETEKAREAKYEADIKQWLLDEGYTGKHTGRIFHIPMGDGYARYMFADAPRKSCLIHIATGDAWNCPEVQFLPKTEVIRRMDAEEEFRKLFRQAK